MVGELIKKVITRNQSFAEKDIGAAIREQRTKHQVHTSKVFYLMGTADDFNISFQEAESVEGLLGIFTAPGMSENIKTLEWEAQSLPNLGWNELWPATLQWVCDQLKARYGVDAEVGRVEEIYVA